jgi:hypothetical protein
LSDLTLGSASSRVQGKHSHSAAEEIPFAPSRWVYQPQLGRKTMEPHQVPKDPSEGIADDLLRGADEIAEFIFGKKGGRRKVYYLAETSHLPVFRLGAVLCARRSVLLSWISGQESRVRRPRE